MVGAAALVACGGTNTNGPIVAEVVASPDGPILRLTNAADEALGDCYVAVNRHEGGYLRLGAVDFSIGSAVELSATEFANSRREHPIRFHSVLVNCPDFGVFDINLPE